MGRVPQSVLGSTPFSMIHSILMFDFDLILQSFFYFLGSLWAIFGVGVGFKNCFGVYSFS